jgi:hypothetical protein
VRGGLGWGLVGRGLVRRVEFGEEIGPEVFELFVGGRVRVVVGLEGLVARDD